MDTTTVYANGSAASGRWHILRPDARRGVCGGIVGSRRATAVPERLLCGSCAILAARAANATR